MRTLVLLSALAAPCVLYAQAPPQSTLPLHVPCEVRPPAPAQAEPARPTKKGNIEEWSDREEPQRPRGVKDDRQMAQTTTGVPELDALAAEAKKRNAVVRQGYYNGTQIDWYRAYPDGRIERLPSSQTQAQPRQEVAAQQPFRNVYRGTQYIGRECEYDPDHVCNRCGTVQLEIDHYNSDGTHTHRCPRCSHRWRH